MRASKAARLALLGAALTATSCEHAPAIDVLGSFFPSWIFCIGGGIAGTFIADRVMIRFGARADYGPPVLVYTSLVVLIACLLWLISFR